MYQQVPQRGVKKKKNLDPVMKLLRFASKTTEGAAHEQDGTDDRKTKTKKRCKLGPSEPARRPEPPPVSRPIRKKNRRELTWEDSMFIKEDIITAEKEVRGGLAIMLGKLPFESTSLSDDFKHNLSSSSLLGRTRGNRRKVASKGAVVSVVFQELLDLDIPPLVIPYTERTTIEDLMSIAVIQHMHERKNKPPLAGQMGEQYELRIVDEDDSDLEIEMDLPPLGREKLIGDLNLSVFGMCFKGKRNIRHLRQYNTNDHNDIKPPEVSINLGRDSFGDFEDDISRDGRQKRFISLSGLNKGTTIDFIRIMIPGPSSTTMTLHLQKDIEYNIQDLFPMVNKKRKENLVNSEFFSFYYVENRKLIGGALPNRMSAHHLTKDELLLLPSVEICNKIHQEGFNSVKSEVDQLPLLSVLRPKEFKVWKIGDRGKKKVRRLAIGRYLIRKTVLEDNSLLKKDHVPIEIGKIIKCHRAPTSKRIFNLIYNHITLNQEREQVYEAAGEEQCAEIVDKINFFRKLSIYYGSEDIDGEVLKARKARNHTLIRRRNMKQ